MFTLILSGLLFALALYSGYSALNLVPTDLGFAWMNGAIIFLSASLVVLAIRFAALGIEKRLTTLQASLSALMAAGLTSGTDPDLPPLKPDPVIAEPGIMPSESAAFDTGANRATAQTEPRTAGVAILAGAGMLAAGGAALAAGAAKAADEPEASDLREAPAAPDGMPALSEAIMPDETSPEHPDTPKPAVTDSLIAELERDIFAEFPVLKGDAPASLFPLSPATASDDPDADILEAPVAEVTPLAEVLADTVDASPEIAPEAATEAIALDEPSPEPVQDELAAESDPAPDVEDGKAEVADGKAEVADIILPLPDLKELPAPGLIADDDLAALETSEPPLAPLETLEIVGAYDSGGTRFTMYSDGSVTATGPTLDRRFSSLDALRAYIDAGATG